MLKSVLTAIVLTFSIAVAGCGSETIERPNSRPQRSTTQPDAATHTERTQAVLDQIAQAVEAGDLGAFTAAISDRDRSFPRRAKMIFDNLNSLPLSAFRLTARSGAGELSASRHSQLGPDSWVQQATLSWQLKPDASPAVHTVWLSMVPHGDAAQLAGTTDIPPDRAGPLPLWWLVPVIAEQSDDVTTLVDASLKADGQWARAAGAALARVRSEVRGLDSGWSGTLVVQVPSTTTILEQMVAARRGSYDQIAAVTWADGTNTARAPLRIVLNPSPAGKLSDLGIQLLLAHEATHVATHSVDSPAPAWMVEGFADYVAYRAYPQARKAATAPLLARVKGGYRPASLPDNERFGAATDRLELAYAEAWLACRYVADQYSPEQLTELYRELDSGRSFEQAAPSVLEINSAEFVSGWRNYLLALAR
jgi:hypothetical protein